eukprot:augustus_masked-scaffold_43-processed-gene-1.9-mRNA-1 protein AED:1.00 eAED:1.00 QI:0/-1/0/0/-1/1/1/0/923
MSDSDDSSLASSYGEETTAPVKRKKKQKRPSKPSKSARNNLFEEEVDVTSGDEESDVDEEPQVSRAELTRHERETQRKYDERRMLKEAFQERSEADIARDLEARHRQRSIPKGSQARGGVQLSRNANLPTVTDPRLYAIRCKPGEETLLVIKLMNKYIATSGSKRNFLQKGMDITSVTHPGGKGYIYVESRSEQSVKSALHGLRGVFQKLTLIPLSEMVSVMGVKGESNVKKPLKKGQLVRIKGYPGDLAQVMRPLSLNKAVIKMVPRIDYDGFSRWIENGATTKKEFRKDADPALLNLSRLNQMLDESAAEEVTFEPLGVSAQYVHLLESYFIDGYLVKEINTRSLKTDQISPTIDELNLLGLVKNGEVPSDLVQETSNHLSVGDLAVVISGQLQDLAGKVIEVNPSSVKLRPIKKTELGDLEFAPSELAKLFANGERVKVLTGIHKGATGSVVQVDAGQVVVYLDVSSKEITVDANYLQHTREVSGGTDMSSGYKLYDRIRASDGSIGIVVSVADGVLGVAAYSGVLQRPVSTIVSKLQPFKLTRLGASTSNGVAKINDTVRVLSGKHKGSEGIVKLIDKSILFVHSKHLLTDAGILVVPSRSCQLLTSTKSNEVQAKEKRVSFGSNQMNPLFQSSSPSRGFEKRGSRSGFGSRNHQRVQFDDLKGETVKITRGRYKGYVGMVTGNQGPKVKVELHSKSKTITLPKNHVITMKSSKPSTVPETQKPARRKFLVTKGNATPTHQPTSSINYDEMHAQAEEKLTELSSMPVKTPGVATVAVDSHNYASIKTPGLSTVKTPGPSFVKTPGPSTVNTPGVSFVKTPGVSTMQTPAVTTVQTPGPGSESWSVKTPGAGMALKTPGAAEIDAGNELGEFADKRRVKIKTGNHEGQHGLVQAVDGDDVFIQLEKDGELVLEQRDNLDV